MIRIGFWDILFYTYNNTPPTPNVVVVLDSTYHRMSSSRYIVHGPEVRNDRLFGVYRGIIITIRRIRIEP